MACHESFEVRDTIELLKRKVGIGRRFFEVFERRILQAGCVRFAE
jgi:hypothetical protein